MIGDFASYLPGNSFEKIRQEVGLADILIRKNVFVEIAGNETRKSFPGFSRMEYDIRVKPIDRRCSSCRCSSSLP